MKTLKSISAFLIISLLIYACGHGGKKPTETVASAPLISNGPDTLILDGKVIKLQPIDSSEFLKLSGDVFRRDTAEVIEDTMNVYRNDSTLVLRFENGDSTLLLSTPNNMSDNAVKYVYLKYIKELNSYFIDNEYYEGGDYSLWNKSTGKENRVFGYPCLSPDKKTVLCYNLDVQVQYTSNGFQIFEVGKDSLHLKWETQVQNWGPEECKWKDSRELLIKAAYYDSIGYKAKYVSIELPGLK